MLVSKYSRLRRILAVILTLTLFSSSGVRSSHAEQTFFSDVAELIEELLEENGFIEPVRKRALVKPDPHRINEHSKTLKKMLNAELHYVQKVCHPKPQQFDQIRNVGIEEIKTIARLLEEKQRDENGHPLDLRAMVTSTLARKIEEVLPAETSKRYRQEIAARKKARADAAAGMMTSLIDQKVELSTKQSVKLNRAIRQHWDPQWASYIQVCMTPEYGPLPEDSVVMPILSPAQRKLWSIHPKHHPISFGWRGDLGFNGWIRGGNRENIVDMPVSELPK